MHTLRNVLVCMMVLAASMSAAAQGRSFGSTFSDAPSQISGGSGIISGKILLPSGGSAGRDIRLRLFNSSLGVSVAYTDSNGSFTLGNLEAGTYQIEVQANPRMYEPVSEQVNLLSGGRAYLTLHLRLKGELVTSERTGAVVTVDELSQQIPKSARKEYDRATRMLREGKAAKATDHLKRAIEIFPEYLKARNDLGAQYLKQNRATDAAEQLEAAVQIGPRACNPRINLAIADLMLGRHAEAASHLRTVISIDGSRPAAHLYLGIALTAADDLAGAERALGKALSIGGEAFSIAHYYLAQVRLKKGDNRAARQELQEFLKNGATGERAAHAQSLLRKLEQAG